VAPHRHRAGHRSATWDDRAVEGPRSATTRFDPPANQPSASAPRRARTASDASVLMVRNDENSAGWSAEAAKSCYGAPRSSEVHLPDFLQALRSLAPHRPTLRGSLHLGAGRPTQPGGGAELRCGRVLAGAPREGPGVTVRGTGGPAEAQKGGGACSSTAASSTWPPRPARESRGPRRRLIDCRNERPGRRRPHALRVSPAGPKPWPANPGCRADRAGSRDQLGVGARPRARSVAIAQVHSGRPTAPALIRCDPWAATARRRRLKGGG